MSTTSAMPAKPPVRMRTLLIYVVLPALLALVTMMLVRYVLKQNAPFDRLFVYAFFVWIYWSVLSNPLTQLNERFPLAEGLRLSRVSVHAATLVVTSIGFMLWEAVVWYVAVGNMSFDEIVTYLTSTGIFLVLSIGAVVYLMLTGLLTAGIYLERWKAVKNGLEGVQMENEPATAMNGNGTNLQYPGKILVKNRGTARLIDVNDIEWIEAMDYCVALHCADGEHVLRRSMKSFESDLDPRLFFRIHRSAIVNLDAIKEMQREVGGDYSVIMRDGSVLKLVRNRMEQLENALSLRSH